MLPNGRPLGAHLPLGHGMVKAADRAAEIGASAIQVFADNPTSWRRRPTLPRELPAFRERVAHHRLAPLAIHAPYLVNLAGPDDAFFAQSVAVLANELRVGAAYGARYVNVHAGSHRGAGPAAGTERFATGMALLFEDLLIDPVPPADRPVLVIENGSGGGFGMGATLEELAAIDAAVAAAGVPRAAFGFCLDTAHLWGAGYGIDTAARVDALLEAFDARIGIGRLRLLHLNDSRAELGSRTDRHEHVAAGRIGAAGMRRILTHPALDHVAYILETPGMDEGYDAVNMGRALAVAAGRPLDDLPPEAFETRSSRGRGAPAEDRIEGPPLDGGEVSAAGPDIAARADPAAG
jgi:deoxyribonuclease IV